MLAHNHVAFNQLSKLCPGESKKHRHLPWGITPAGHFATSEETAYPIQLARDVAQCFIQALAGAGMKLPPSQLQDMTSSSEAVFQAVRAQSGIQPKHSKLPPLVPEFATIIAVEVSSDTPSSQPPHSQIPQHNKFLNSAPLVTPPVKGGGSECRPPENSANDRIVQKWGVYHTPEEFVRKAAQAGHPQSLETCLPEVLKQALQSHRNQTSIARIKKRTVVMREWVKRADSLKSQEHELKSRLDPQAKHILSHKKIFLWKSLLEEHKYPDMAVVSELLEGTKLIGETDTTGLWPAKFVPATISEIELYDISARERESICNKVKETPSETDRAVWDKTLEEVEKGWLLGPFDPQQILSHYPLSRRFGVVQGEKTRCVDEFSTLDRLVDGSVAAHAMSQTAHMMHPSQAVMSYFKEPQKAVSCIQRILDGDDPAITLLADLSKAFERVNPYWILEFLRIKRAPRWLFAYTKFILFHRRVSHKVQGRLLPSRTILMGRSFSVYLFCLAMDPLFTYLNRIPGVISVQGYVDDTSIAGDAQNLEWLTQVAECYSNLRTAGFVVDPHSCFRACLTIHNRLQPCASHSGEVESQWPGLLSSEPYPTVLAAMNANCRPGYNTAVVRVGSALTPREGSAMPSMTQCYVGVFAFQQIQDIRTGRHMHHLGAFATIGCKCKSKSNILTNMALRSGALRKIEDSGFGVQAICAKAPSLGLALVGRYELTGERDLGKVEVPRGLDNYNKAKVFLSPNPLDYCQMHRLQHLHLKCYALYHFLLWPH